MCPTVLGRVQTRWAILIIPAIILAIISAVTQNPSWIVLLGLYYIIGVALDTGFYPFIIRWQPPWLTFVLAVGEFILVYLAARLLKGIHFSSPVVTPILIFWLSWIVAIWTKVVILPLLSLSWIENAGEFRSTDWSVAPEYAPIPLTAFPSQQASAGAGPPPLARKFSAAVIEIPEELRRAPSPSGVFQVPPEMAGQTTGAPAGAPPSA
jgi:hypothetical protein